MIMPRQIRNIGNTGWAHIIVRGINRENLFYDEEDHERFSSALERYQRESGAEIPAWCQMSNHVHLLMYVENGGHAQVIKKLLISYAAYYNRKYDRVGPVFQDRFRSEAIHDERYLLAVARYIYQNPQKAGICPAREYRYTCLQLEGVLSGFFDSAEDMYAYLEEVSEDRFLEYDSSRHYTDSEAQELIASVTGNSNPQGLQEMDRELRDRALCQLKDEGLTVRQISRLTGLNRNIIQRA